MPAWRFNISNNSDAQLVRPLADLSQASTPLDRALSLLLGLSGRAGRKMYRGGTANLTME